MGPKRERSPSPGFRSCYYQKVEQWIFSKLDQCLSDNGTVFKYNLPDDIPADGTTQVFHPVGMDREPIRFFSVLGVQLRILDAGDFNNYSFEPNRLFMSIAHLVNLEELVIPRLLYGEKYDFSFLCGYPRLSKLNLSRTMLFDDFPRVIHELSKTNTIKELDLGGADMSDDSYNRFIYSIGSLSNLQVLTFRTKHEAIVQTCLALSELKQLRFLTLTGVSLIPPTVRTAQRIREYSETSDMVFRLLSKIITLKKLYFASDSQLRDRILLQTSARREELAKTLVVFCKSNDEKSTDTLESIDTVTKIMIIDEVIAQLEEKYT